MEFHKYHALGNDYLVYDPERLPFDLDAQGIERVCHRNFGLGSDGILLGPLPSNQARFRLRIFNPDASEAEKSGNGIRIFCRFLFDTGRVSEGESFTLETLGGLVSAEVHDKGQRIKVSMGRAEFKAGRIPVKTADPDSEVIRMPIEVDGNTLEFCAVSVGNPHCVIPLDTISAELAKRIGSSVEHHPMFPNRINMQLLKVIDRSNIQIEIWERGAGYTLASGTSSCACAVIARKLGLCDRDITVHMPGGSLSIQVEDDFSLTMTGPTTRVGHYVLHPECLKA